MKNLKQLSHLSVAFSKNATKKKTKNKKKKNGQLHSFHRILKRSFKSVSNPEAFVFC